MERLYHAVDVNWYNHSSNAAALSPCWVLHETDPRMVKGIVNALTAKSKEFDLYSLME